MLETTPTNVTVNALAYPACTLNDPVAVESSWDVLLSKLIVIDVVGPIGAWNVIEHVAPEQALVGVVPRVVTAWMEAVLVEIYCGVRPSALVPRPGILTVTETGAVPVVELVLPDPVTGAVDCAAGMVPGEPPPPPEHAAMNAVTTSAIAMRFISDVPLRCR
jgi:hypothetical protein